MGYSHTNVELMIMFSGVDVDGDDEIDFNEFATLIASQLTNLNENIFSRKPDGLLDMEPVGTAFRTFLNQPSKSILKAPTAQATVAGASAAKKRSPLL